MEILFDNPLAAMYGPYFLIFFGFVIFFAIVTLALVKNQFDKTDRLATPSISPNLDPFEVAYLRGGTNEMARAVVFSLLQKGLVEINGAGDGTVINRAKPSVNNQRLSQIEETALSWFSLPQTPKEMFVSNGLAAKLEGYAEGYRQTLERQQYLVDDQTRSSFRNVKWSVILLIIVLGAYKAITAVINEQYNIMLLIIFTIGGLLIANLVSKLPRVTKLGQLYLDRLQTAFSQLRYNAQKAFTATNQSPPAPTFAGVDPLLLSVGVFGAGVLAGTAYYNYNLAFHRAQAQANAGGSGCGSAGCGSCSSSSSGDSGGSDSGGSSCGGGCGGGGCS